MQRRQVLATLAALPLAGCLASPDGGDTTPDPTDTTDHTTISVTPPFETVDFQVLHAECATEDATDATVSFEGSAVVVEGTIVGADACYVAQLAGVSYDEGADDLRVVVESVREADDDTACAQCITAIDYRMRMDFADALPGTVTVVHRRGGTDETVASVDRA